MKKVSILLICMLLSLSLLTACGRDRDNNNGNNNAANNNTGNNAAQDGITGQQPGNSNVQTPADDLMDGAEDAADGIADGVRGLWDGLTDFFNPDDYPRTTMGDETAYAEYGLSDDLIEDYTLQVPENGDTAHEFFIAKVRDGKMAEVEAILEKRKEAIAANWAEHTEDDYEYARQPVIYKSGNYIMLAVYDDTDDLRAEFERLVSKMEEK